MSLIRISARALPLLAAFLVMPAFAQDGVPDPTFGTDGVVYVTPDDVEAREITPAVTIVLPDGKLLIAGTRNKYNPLVPFEPEIRATLVRLNADGSVDDTFGDTSIPGVVVLPNLVAGARMEGIESMQRLDDGSLIAVGISRVNGPLNGFIVKLAEDGSIDTGFGDNGLVLMPWMYTHAVVVDSKGRIVIAGEHYDSGVFTSMVSRFLADGTPDDSFGDGGTTPITWDGAGNSGFLSDMKLVDGDEILVGGQYSVYGDGFGGDYALARLDSNGDFDSAFAGTGWLVFHDDATASMVNTIDRIAVTSDGGVAFAGYYMKENSATAFLLGHVLADGSIDPAFGDAATPGFFRPAIVPNAQNANSLGLVVQADGKLIASVSYVVDAPDKEDFLALRTTATGQLDETFADGGIYDADLAPDGVGSDISSIALQPDGNLILAGRSQRDDQSPIVDLAVVRLLNGSAPTDRIFASGFED